MASVLFQPYKPDFSNTSKLWNKEPTSKNCFLKTAQKTAYVVAAAFMAVLESIQYAGCKVLNLGIRAVNAVHGYFSDKTKTVVEVPKVETTVAESVATAAAAVDTAPASAVAKTDAKVVSLRTKLSNAAQSVASTTVSAVKGFAAIIFAGSEDVESLYE